MARDSGPRAAPPAASRRPFGPFIADYLRRGGAEVVTTRLLTQAALGKRCDAVILALRPGADAVLTDAGARLLAQAAPAAVLLQFWGDADREALAAARVPVWPPDAPRPGHMGVLPSDIGPEPVVRLQAGGLKVGELLARGLDQAAPDELALVQLLC